MGQGFVNWQGALSFIMVFLIIVGITCFFVAHIGSTMVNDIGNHPTRAARIQFHASWKLLLGLSFGFLMLFIFFNICLYLESLSG